MRCEALIQGAGGQTAICFLRDVRVRQLRLRHLLLRFAHF